MRKISLLFLLIAAKACFASDGAAMYGTADNPQINGAYYDVHQAYIEPNPGYRVKQNSSALTQADMQPKQVMVRAATESVKSPSTQVKKPIDFKSDSWASDPKLERVLKQAASEGKLSYVLDQAKKANVPASVAIVPMVESNYNKTAVSPKGAGGAWQLMPGTAGDYGLSSSERFNFTSSTNVAIQILDSLHQKFGNWALAFAAYNCGDQCVVNALKKNPHAKDIDELSLPKETKQYVHKIIQLNQLIAGLDIPNNMKNSKLN